MSDGFAKFDAITSTGFLIFTMKGTHGQIKRNREICIMFVVWALITTCNPKHAVYRLITAWRSRLLVFSRPSTPTEMPWNLSCWTRQSIRGASERTVHSPPALSTFVRRVAVSYTHLDVYKRQVAHNERWGEPNGANECVLHQSKWAHSHNYIVIVSQDCQGLQRLQRTQSPYNPQYRGLNRYAGLHIGYRRWFQVRNSRIRLRSRDASPE